MERHPIDVIVVTVAIVWTHGLWAAYCLKYSQMSTCKGVLILIISIPHHFEVCIVYGRLEIRFDLTTFPSGHGENPPIKTSNLPPMN